MPAGHALKYPRILVRKMLTQNIYIARCYPAVGQPHVDVKFKSPGAAVLRAEMLARQILNLTSHEEVYVEDRTGTAAQPITIHRKNQLQKRA